MRYWSATDTAVTISSDAHELTDSSRQSLYVFFVRSANQHVVMTRERREIIVPKLISPGRGMSERS